MANENSAERCLNDFEDNPSSYHASYINCVRIALSVALIKSKPGHMDIEQHVQCMKDAFASTQCNWKRQYEMLEAELMKMRQANTLSKLYCSQGIVPHHDFPTPPQTQESSLQCNQPAGVVEQNDTDNKFSQADGHIVFLRKICCLQQASDVLIIQNSEAMVVVQDTVLSSVKLLHSALMVRPGVCDKLFTDLVSSLVNLARVSPCIVQSCEINDKVSSLLKEALLELVRTQEKEIQQSVYRMLQSFSVVRSYKTSIVGMSLDFIKDLISIMQTVKSRSFCHLAELENVPIVTRLVRELLWKESDQFIAEVTCMSSLHCIMESLERLLVRFPLCAIHVHQFLTDMRLIRL